MGVAYNSYYELHSNVCEWLNKEGLKQAYLDTLFFFIDEGGKEHAE